ncbi:MAG: hypothetical protein AAF708_16595 [Deinococcota bacterium]
MRKLSYKSLGVQCIALSIFMVGIVQNQLNPNLSTALGVAFISLAALIISATGGIIVEVINARRHKKLVMQSFAVTLVGIGLFIVLFLLANAGRLSVVTN